MDFLLDTRFMGGTACAISTLGLLILVGAGLLIYFMTRPRPPSDL